jgi:putative Ca2+/H+ antiporter (TMEM165/GDT1 family)
MSWTAVFGSFALVAVSEMGDKTQLLAFALASRFRRPWPVMAGILVATLANHGLASTLGAWLSAHVPPRASAAVLAVSFLAFGIWTLRPDKEDDDDGKPSRFGPFLTTAVLFFLAEMGDKTQLATIALGAKFHSAALVTLGTTLGMAFSDGLAVFAGDRLAGRVQGRWLRIAAATLFFAFGLVTAWTAIAG